MSYFIAYDFKLPLSSENYQEKILDFDIAFIRNAHKYGLMYLGNIDTDKFIMDYRSMREKCFFREEYKNYCLLDIGQLSKLFSKNYDASLSIRFVSLDIYFFKSEEMAEKCILFFNVSSDATYVQDVENLAFWEEYTSLGLLFDNEDLYNIPYDTKIAYIPRFNSFLREISKVVKEMGGKVTTDCLPEEFMTIDGFLLNGRIIYQEDIEEGREPFPIMPPPYIEYWLERDMV